MTPSTIHPALLGDCHVLGRVAQGHLLLHRNAAVAWYILVPETDTHELLDLPPAARDAVVATCSDIAQHVRRHHGAQRINFGAIGNLVPQLHVHVVGRGEDDPCWPLPVWGHLDNGPAYRPDELAAIRTVLVRNLALAPED